MSKVRSCGIWIKSRGRSGSIPRAL